MEYQQRVLDFVMAAGELLLKNGAEVSRTQQTMEILARSLGVDSFHGYVLTNGLFASMGTDYGQPAQIRSVPVNEVHLGRVEAINALSRRIAAGQVDLEQACQELEQIRHMAYAPSLWQIASCGVGSGCFALLFGGSWKDGLIAFLVGLGLQFLLLWMARFSLNKLISRFLGAAFVAGFAVMLYQIPFGLHMDMAIIGALMPLVPGMALTLGIRDLLMADFLSGTIRMLDALLTAGSIACGVGLVLAVANLIPGVVL